MIVRCLSKTMFFINENKEEIIKRKREESLKALHFKWGSSINFFYKDIELKLIPKQVLNKIENKAYIIKTSDDNQIIIQFLENEGSFLRLDSDGILSPIKIEDISLDDSIASYDKFDHDWLVGDVDIIETFNPDEVEKKEKNYFFNYGFYLQRGEGIIINNFMIYN